MNSMYKNGPRWDWYPDIESIAIDNLTSDLHNAIIKDFNSTRGLTPEARKQKENELRQITKKILSALYCAYWTLPKGTIVPTLPLTKELYRKESRSVKELPFSYRYVDAIRKKLEELKWVKIIIGREGKSYSRIIPLAPLVQAFELNGYCWHKQQPKCRSKTLSLKDVVRNKDGSVIRMKGKTTKYHLDVPNSQTTQRYRDNLYKINSAITKHCISLDMNDDQIKILSTAMSNNDQHLGLDLSRVQLERIFARGSMEKGGRFYRGWWQQIPSLYRPHILIDGLRTIEIDYSGMGIAIAYYLLDLPYDNKVDPYDIGLDDWQGKGDPRRKSIKKFVNALINDEDEVFSLPIGQQKLLNHTHTELLEVVKKKTWCNP